MNGISLIETSTLQDLIKSVSLLAQAVDTTITELKEAKKEYLTPEDLMELTGFSRAWVNNNKQDVGYSMVGGCLRFKRQDVEEYMNRYYFKSKKR